MSFGETILMLDFEEQTYNTVSLMYIIIIYLYLTGTDRGVHVCFIGM